eukprot:scaffold1640_cov161-Amphora_coffeaeformis.AAC.25
MVIRLRTAQVLRDGKEETAIAAYQVGGGIDTCMAVKLHWFCFKLSPRMCMVIPVASADNHADIFTKPLLFEAFHATPQEHLWLLTCDFCFQLRANAITHSSSLFVHMDSSIYSQIDNPVQNYSSNKKS